MSREGLNKESNETLGNTQNPRGVDFYMENGFYNSGRHVGIFIVLLIALILFGMFVEKPSEDSNR